MPTEGGMGMEFDDAAVIEALRRESRARLAPSTRKPNLKFLNNIIQDTNAHNAALKLRELESAGDRLRVLHGDPPRERSRDRRRRRRDDDRYERRDGRGEYHSSSRHIGRRSYDNSDSDESSERPARRRHQQRRRSNDEDAACKDSRRHSRDRAHTFRRRRRSRSPSSSRQRVSRRKIEKGGDLFDDSERLKRRDRHRLESERSNRDGTSNALTRRHDRRSRSRSPKRGEHRTGYSRDSARVNSISPPRRSRWRVDEHRLSRSPSCDARTRSSHVSRFKSKFGSPEDSPGVSEDDSKRHVRSRSSSQGSRERHSKGSRASSSSTIGPSPPERPVSSTSMSDPRPSLSSKGIIRRGRGIDKASSNAAPGSAMDMRFSSTYDPKADTDTRDFDGHDHDRSPAGKFVLPARNGDDDWEYSLSSLKARADFQAVQRQRLLDAGFGEEAVARWERGRGGDAGPAGDGAVVVGSDGQVENVRWNGRGQSREWDRGKVLDADGNVSTQVEWKAA